MAFVRTKDIRGLQYAYVVENYRDSDGRRRQRVLRYIGPLDPQYGGRGPVDLAKEKVVWARIRGEQARPEGA